MIKIKIVNNKEAFFCRNAMCGYIKVSYYDKLGEYRERIKFIKRRKNYI